MFNWMKTAARIHWCQTGCVVTLVTSMENHELDHIYHIVYDIMWSLDDIMWYNVISHVVDDMIWYRYIYIYYGSHWWMFHWSIGPLCSSGLYPDDTVDAQTCVWNTAELPVLKYIYIWWFPEIGAQIIHFSGIVSINQPFWIPPFMENPIYMFGTCWFGLGSLIYADFFKWLAITSSLSMNLKIRVSNIWLVGGLEHFLFSHILGIIIPIDVHIFQRGGPTTNQMM